MKLKRSERLIDMTYLLLENPYHLFSLNDFTKKYNAAKSSISEDITILKDTFSSQDIGLVETITGASGGVVYYPYISKERQVDYIEEIIEYFKIDNRVLPGGYLYLSDIISNPKILKKIGLIIASQHVHEEIDYVLTIATKGINLAQAIAYELNIPIIVARKETKVTEGPTVSVKYTSQSAPRIVQSMEIARNSMEKDSRVLIIDDFLRGGGSMEGLSSLVDIFEAHIVAKYVLCENLKEGKTIKDDIKSLIIVEGLDLDHPDLKVSKGTLFG